MKEPKSPPSQATLDHAPATTGRDGAIDFAAKVEASNAERLMLEKGEDFIAHDGGPIELTSTGLKRLVAGHVAGHEVVVEIDKCEVLVVRGPKAFAPPLPPQCAEQLAIAARLRADLRTAGSRARFARWRTQAHRDARWACLC